MVTKKVLIFVAFVLLGSLLLSAVISFGRKETVTVGGTSSGSSVVGTPSASEVVGFEKTEAGRLSDISFVKNIYGYDETRTNPYVVGWEFSMTRDLYLNLNQNAEVELCYLITKLHFLEGKEFEIGEDIYSYLIDAGKYFVSGEFGSSFLWVDENHNEAKSNCKLHITAQDLDAEFCCFVFARFENVEGQTKYVYTDFDYPQGIIASSVITDNDATFITEKDVGYLPQKTVYGNDCLVVPNLAGDKNCIFSLSRSTNLFEYELKNDFADGNEQEQSGVYNKSGYVIVPELELSNGERINEELVFVNDALQVTEDGIYCKYSGLFLPVKIGKCSFIPQNQKYAFFFQVANDPHYYTIEDIKGKESALSVFLSIWHEDIEQYRYEIQSGVRFLDVCDLYNVDVLLQYGVGACPGFLKIYCLPMIAEEAAV